MAPKGEQGTQAAFDAVRLLRVTQSDRDRLIAAHRRALDEAEAEGRGPLTVTEYRNQQNLKRWREQLSRPAESSAHNAPSPRRAGISSFLLRRLPWTWFTRRAQ